MAPLLTPMETAGVLAAVGLWALIVLMMLEPGSRRRRPTRRRRTR